jgi:hypothetical protein
MTTDITLPLDGKLTLTAEPHAYKVPKPPAKPRAPRTTAAKEAQDARLRQLTAQGCIAIRGKQGVTVFNWGHK